MIGLYSVKGFGNNVVNARELHEYLNRSDSFTAFHNQFIATKTNKQTVDYVTFKCVLQGKPSCGVAISTTVAKNIAIVCGATEVVSFIDTSKPTSLYKEVSAIPAKVSKTCEDVGEQPNTSPEDTPVDSDVLIFDGIRCKKVGDEITLNLEDIARGLGFTKTDKKNGKEYVRLDKPRVLKHLESFGISFPKMDSSVYVSESAFYLLAMKANNQAAREFQLKVATEILPQIRKTGSYAPVKKEESDEHIVFKALLIMKESIEKKDAQLLEQKPKVEFHDKLMSSDTAIAIGQFAKMLRIGPNTLFSKLRGDGYLMSGYKTKNTPYQKYITNGYFELKETVATIGENQIIKLQTLVTPKGQHALTPKYYAE